MGVGVGVGVGLGVGVGVGVGLGVGDGVGIGVTDALRDQRGLLISSSVIYGNLAKSFDRAPADVTRIFGIAI